MQVSELKPNPKNPRKVTDKRLEMLKASLKEFGDLSGVVFNRRSGQLIGGHQRVRSLFEGSDEIVIEHRHKKPTTTGTVAVGFIKFGAERYAYREVDFDEQREKAANLAANKGAGDFDMEQVTEWLKEIDDGIFDMDLTMFDEVERTEALPAEVKKGLTEDDAVPEQVPARCKLGELWQLGAHRMLCGDSTDVKCVERLMAGEKADMVFTSPPYNQNLDSFKPSGMQKEHPGWVEKMGSAYFDSLPEEQYQHQQRQLLDLIATVTSSTASVFYNHKHRYRDKQVVSPLSWLWNSSWKLRQEIIWDRSGSLTLNARMFMPVDERIYWLTKADFYFDDSTEIKSWGSIWRIAPKNEIKGVSAPFPNELPTRGILACSKPGNLVLEPYCGSGTTLIACEKTGRRCFGMEIDPKYCDVIITRWEQFTGEKAKQVKA